MRQTAGNELHSITVIGLGLIGGSIAKAARRAGLTVYAVDTHAPSLEVAISEGVIVQGYTELCIQALMSELAIICTPPETVPQIAAQIYAMNPDMLMTDTGSAKGTIMQAVKDTGYRFIGGHPMAGTEKRGYAGSAAHMFENAHYILTPAFNTAPEDIIILEHFVRLLGAQPRIMTAPEHDEAIASVSHLPHILAAALVNTVAARDDEGLLSAIAAGGLRDITRISSSDPVLWAEICTLNRVALADAIEDYRRVLDWAKGACIDADTASLKAFFSSAKTYRDALPQKAAATEAVRELTVDAHDKPGEIGRIATLLGEADINIKSIYLSGTRERGEGVLVIGLASADSAQAATVALEQAGYKVLSV